jgi:hypothetical protein
MQRITFNEHLARVPGLYNENAKVEIEAISQNDQFDFFNLTVQERTNNLNQHFLLIKQHL